jgi:Protein of unknown function (DUF3501)
MSMVRLLTRSDIKGPSLYAAIRDDFRKRIIDLKRPRRVLIGDRVSLVFENRHTLTLQVEEMLRAESLSSDEQIVAELAVYNELMPTADSLSATLFIELPHGADAKHELGKLVGLDEHVRLHIGGHVVAAQFEPHRSTDDKISAVQYVRFPLSMEAKAALLLEETELVVEIDHPNYRHRLVAAPALRASLAQDYSGA